MIRIGELQVDFGRRQISQRGVVVRVSSRAFDILELLSNANGSVVLKSEIMRAVWPSTIVEENNLQVHITTLRKLLGRDRNLILTVPGRGYRLLNGPLDSCLEGRGPVECADVQQWDRSADASGLLIGRESAVVEVLTALGRSESLTLVGAGGIGKTRLAREVARQAWSSYADGVAWVSFSSVGEERFVLDAVASALPFPVTGGPLSIDAIVGAVRGRRLLVVFDSCEHIVDAAARLALSFRNAGCAVLATSREPFQIPGETLYNVGPLDVPAPGSNTASASSASAVRLFIERITALEPAFLVDDRSVDLIGAVCRAIDGIPLAIELAAARAARLGVVTVSSCLGDRLRLLTGGCRTALPRHQTIRATLEWSYRLLNAQERLLFRRLGIFAGAFTLDAACGVTKNCGLSAAETLDALCGLVTKSMVAARPNGQDRRYDLLEVTREYALQKLAENGERRTVARAHAEYLAEVIDAGRCKLKGQATDSPLGSLANEVDNVRAALNWSFSAAGDVAIGVALASVTIPCFFGLCLMTECCSYAELALNASRNLDAQSEVTADLVLKLRTVFAASLLYSRGPTIQTRRAWAKLYSDALRSGNTEYEAQALLGMWGMHRDAGEAEDALRVVDRFRDLTRSVSDSTAHGLLGLGVEGIALHHLGEHEKARGRHEAMLRTLGHSMLRWNAAGFQMDQRLVARATLARVLWLQGDEQNALQGALQAFDDAIPSGNKLIICHVLAEAVIPIAILMDEVETAQQAIAKLNEISSRMSFEPWIACGSCYEQCIGFDMGDHDRPRALASSIARLKLTGFLSPLTFLLCRLGQALLDLGESEEANAVIDEALAHGDSTGDRWFYPEVCRMKGLALLSMGVTAAAGNWLLAALENARHQNAKSLEVRAAVSVQHWYEEKRRGDWAFARVPELGFGVAHNADAERL
ncbi:MAG: winged helix-turn-helix domain-containing protein [Paraburkholderia sp.]|uniref:winged helix-turn-helix domain-containing protein n=1 Tax=Paraburkholderia sp. TaxID=1926495 RepID=UPI003C40C47C